MIIEGFRQAIDPIMQDQAFEIAKRWIYGNYKVYAKTKKMFEKYDVVGSTPEPGGGGEYPVVVGFGWSNGVILDLLYTYYDRIQAPPKQTQTETSTPKGNLASVTLVSCTLPMLVITYLNTLF